MRIRASVILVDPGRQAQWLKTINVAETKLKLDVE